MKIIDAHAHIASWPTIKKSENLILESMKKYGISYALVSNCDVAEFSSVGPKHKPKSTLKGLKEVVSFCKANPDKIGGLVWFKAKYEVPTKELIDYIEKNREYIHALKFHPYCARLRITSRKLIPWIKLARKLDMPIQVHTAQDIYSDIKYLEIVAKRYPDVKFVAAHIQLCSDNKAGVLAMKHCPNIYGDTAWVNMKVSAKILRTFGPERVMFGTDNPIDGLDTYANAMYKKYYRNACKLNETLYKNLMHDNAMRLYKVKD